MLDEEMDGEAFLDAFETSLGPDCLKDIIPKYESLQGIARTAKTHSWQNVLHMSFCIVAINYQLIYKRDCSTIVIFS